MNLIKISENENMVSYVDLESIVKSGSFFRYTEVIDWRSPRPAPNGAQSSSHRLVAVINVETKEQSILEVTDYAGHMCTGEIIHEGVMAENIRTIPAESLSHKMMDFLINIKSD